MAERYTPKTSGDVLAIRLDENNSDNVSNWCGGQVLPDLGGSERTAIEVPTLSSNNAVALIGDWIVKSERNGRFFVMTNAEFKDKYDLVEFGSISLVQVQNA